MWIQASYYSKDQIIIWARLNERPKSNISNLKSRNLVKGTAFSVSFGFSAWWSLHYPCLNECAFDYEKSRKGKKKEKKVTQTPLPGFKLDFLPQLLASPARNLTTQTRKQKTRSVSSLNIMSGSRNPPSEKETLLKRKRKLLSYSCNHLVLQEKLK